MKFVQTTAILSAIYLTGCSFTPPREESSVKFHSVQPSLPTGIAYSTASNPSWLEARPDAEISLPWSTDEERGRSLRYCRQMSRREPLPSLVQINMAPENSDRPLEHRVRDYLAFAREAEETMGIPCVIDGFFDHENLSVDLVNQIDFDGFTFVLDEESTNLDPSLSLYTNQGAKIWIKSKIIDQLIESDSYKQTRFKSSNEGYMTSILQSNGAPLFRSLRTTQPAYLITPDSGPTTLTPHLGEIIYTVSNEAMQLNHPDVESIESTMTLSGPKQIGYDPFTMTLSYEPTASTDSTVTYRRIDTEWNNAEHFRLLSMKHGSGPGLTKSITYEIMPLGTLPSDYAAMKLLVYPRQSDQPFAYLVHPVERILGGEITIKPASVGDRRFVTEIRISDPRAEETELRFSAKTASGKKLRLFPQSELILSSQSGESISRKLEIRGDHPGGEAVIVTVEAMLSTGETVSQSEELWFPRAPRLTGVEIDGNLSEWPEKSDRIALDRRDQIMSELAPWQGLKDVSATVMTAWDEDYLYIAAEVTDDQLSSPVEGFDLYRNDGVEIYIDANLLDDYGGTRYTKDDNQVGLFWQQGEPVVFQWSHARSIMKEGIVAAAVSDNGYTIEGAIPHAITGIEPQDGLRIGFAAGVSDDDSTEDDDPRGQETQLFQTARPLAFRNPSAFAQLTFVESLSDD